MSKHYNIGSNNGRYGKKPCNYLGNFISKTELINEYIINKKTIAQIAKEYNCSYSAMRYRLIQSEVSIRSFSMAFKGLKKSKKHKNKIKKSLKKFYVSHPDDNKGKNNSNYGKKHPEINKGIKRSDATRKKLSLAKKGMYIGKNNPHFGKPVRPKWGKYKNINMRSSWEIKYAKYLDENKIKWLYEPKTFDLGDSTYTPDFYLPKTNEYIEIKGYFPDKCKKKLNKFRVLYPKENFSILQGKELSNLGIKIEERFKK